jgi:hypothetical protein
VNTTELFAEQVLAGLLVMLTGGLVFYWQLRDVYRTHMGSADYLEQIVAGGFILGAAYLIGMVYDRVADTLLQDLESHGRLQFAFRPSRVNPYKVNDLGVPTQDPFEDGKYRMLVLANPQATEHYEYLRSRIRLTRALTVAIPGLMMALLLAMDWGRASRWWGWLALTIPLVYLAILILKLLLKRWKRLPRPPKTYELDQLSNYYIDRTRLLPKRCDGKKRAMWALFYDEVWIGLLLLFGFASLLIVSTRSYVRFWIPAAGLLLTLLVGWVWWRISFTFYAFLRDYNDYGIPEQKMIVDKERSV